MISLVQSASQNYGGGFSLAFGSDNTAGNMLVVLTNQVSSSFTITDTAGNTWSLLSSITLSGSTVGIWVCYSCNAGPNTVTIGGTGITIAAFTIAEFSGVNTLDTGASFPAPGASGATWASNAITTSYPNELLLGFVANGVAPTLTVDPPFAVLDTNFGYFTPYYQIVSSIQTGVTATGTLQAGIPPDDWGYGLFGFFESSAIASVRRQCSNRSRCDECDHEYDQRRRAHRRNGFWFLLLRPRHVLRGAGRQRAIRRDGFLK